MTKVNCLNPISELGTGLFNNNYEMTDNFADADVALVRSAAMHAENFSLIKRNL